jgi:uncharacterized membrane protein YgcG
MRRGLWVAIAICAALLAPAAVHAQRTLSWDALDVTARVEADGALHVVEEHQMRFDGAWNGGERSFRLERGQRLELLALERIDPDTGAVTPLERGSLDRVDRYDWAGRGKLRWRSRLPSDPPFDDQLLVYRLTYRLENVVEPVTAEAVEKDGFDFILDCHDFAFPERLGPIRRFTLDLSTEPPFRADADALRPWVLENLPPGQGAVRTILLAYGGDGRPGATVPPPPSYWLRLVLLVSLGTALVLLLVGFVQGEKAKGRLFGAPPDHAVERSWLDTHLFSLPPEVVGAVWDRAIGSPEVAAVLARLVAEGKLDSEVTETDAQGKPKEMRLARRVPLDELDADDRPLVEGLLYDGRETVTTGELRSHYRSTGFQPASLVRPAITEKRDAVLGPTPSPRTQLKVACLGIVAALGVFVGILGFVVVTGSPTLVPAIGGLFFTGTVSLVVALLARDKIFHLGRWTVGMLAPAAFFVLFAALQILLPPDLGGPRNLVELFVLAVLAVAVWWAPLAAARSQESPRSIDIRKQFTRARRHLERELLRESPDLDDAWFPYLLALGLAPAVGRWAEQFGGRQTLTSLPTSVGSVGGSGSSGGGFTGDGGWTGGGAAFGGAGASASWATAAAAMTSGVSPPASSSGGGGGYSGGSSSSSSGGGGGGGW